MDFSYSEMQIEIKNLALKILTEIATVEHLKTQEKQGPYLDLKIWQQCIEGGLHSAALPELLGGMGMDFMAVALVSEAIGQSLASIPFIPCIASTALPLLDHSKDPVIEKILRDVASGRTLVTTALIEPGNEAAHAPRSRASHVAGKWQVSGTKHCVPYADQSSRVLVFAKSDDGLWAGLVDPHDAACTLKPQHATTNEPQYLLAMENANAHAVAKGTQAEALLEKLSAMTTVACCSMAVGVADKMMRLSGQYTSQRVQFGVPVATFQAVSHRLANCYIDVECLKISTQKAASDVAQGIYNSDAIHMAKVWCGDVLHRVSQASQHVHGGTGIDRDYHLFRYCLWAKQLELALGNSRDHLEIIGDRIAEHYLARA